MVAAWKTQYIPSSWCKAVTIFIPKEKDSQNLSQFRSIALLNVEGKILTSFLARHITSFLLANNYIDTRCQKAGVPGFPGICGKNQAHKVLQPLNPGHCMLSSWLEGFHIPGWSLMQGFHWHIHAAALGFKKRADKDLARETKKGSFWLRRKDKALVREGS